MTTTEQQPEVEEDQDLAQVKGALKRERARRAEALRELGPLRQENGELRRMLGLARAHVDPDSVLGQLVATAAAADGIDDPDAVAGIAAQLRDEFNRRRNQED